MKRFAKVTALFFILVTCFNSQASSQHTESLQVGDTLPGEIAIKLVGKKIPKRKISDFKGQLLILDFWDIWCGTCIEAMPKMHELQNLFAADIFILPITKNKRDAIIPFAKKNKILSKLDFYSAVEDTLLHKVFPHTMVPHVVWIGKDGVVKAITSSTEVNETNIQAILNGKDIELKEKRDVIDYDHTKPLLIGNNGSKEDNYLHRSVITAKIEGISTQTGGPFENIDGSIRFRASNTSILGLYKLAFKELLFLPNSKMILEVPNKSTYLNQRFLKPAAGDSIAEDKLKIYCYDLSTARKDPKLIRKFIKNDLDLFFGLNGRMEKRLIKCIVLKKNANAIETAELNNETQKLAAFVNKFNDINGNPFIINETGSYSPMIPLLDLHIDFDALKKKLSEFGIDCQLTEREMEVFVLSEKIDLE